MEIMHFNSQKERLAYLKGGFEEIAPIEVSVEGKEEEPKPKKVTKKKGKKKDDTVQAE